MPSLWQHPSSSNSSLRILQDPEHSSYKRSKAGGWETTEWVKCLLCQCEDLSSDPQHPYNTSTGWGWAWGAGRPASLDKMSSSYSETLSQKPTSKKQLREITGISFWLLHVPVRMNVTACTLLVPAHASMHTRACVLMQA